MGDNDIYVKFGTDADQDKWVEADWTAIGAGKFAEDGDSLRIQNNDGGYYKQVFRNIPNATWDIAFKVWISLTPPSHTLFFVKLNDGYYYIIGAVGTGASIGASGSEKTTSRPTTGYDTLVNDGLGNNIPDSTEHWLGLRFHTNGDVDTLKGLDAGSRDPPTMSVLKTTAMSGASGGKIIEIGFLGIPGSMDYHRLYIEASVSTPEGGTATIINMIGVDVLTSIGAKGGGVVLDQYETQAEARTIKANIGKSITISETIYGNMIGKYEIIDIEWDYTNKIATYILEEGSKKLLETRTGIVTALVSSSVHRAEDNVISNKLAEWSTNAYADNIITFADDNQYLNRIFPFSTNYDIWDAFLASDWHIATADIVVGDHDDMYYEEGGNRSAFGLHTANQIGNGHTGFRIRNSFKFWSKDDIEWDDVTLEFVVRYTSLATSNITGLDEAYPAVWIWNFDTTSWDLIFQYTKKNRDTGNVEDDETWLDAGIDAADGGKTAGMSPIFTEKFDLLAELGVSRATFKSDYMETPSAANANGYKSSNIIIALAGPRVELFPWDTDPKMELHYMAIEFSEEETKATRQAQETGAAKIASNTATEITIDDSAFGVADAPAADGISFNDPFVITSNLEVQVAQFFTAHAVFSLSTHWNSNYTAYAEPGDILNMMMSTWLDKISAIHNWFWMHVPTETEDAIEIWDNIPASGVTFTRADIVKGFPPTIRVSGAQLKELILVYGFNGLFGLAADGSEYNVEFGNTLGDTHAIYNDDTLISQRNIERYLLTKQAIHENADIFVEWTLDYDAIPAGKNYSGIKKGKSVVLDDTALDMQTGNTTLFIDSIRYQNMPPNNRQLIKAILRVRTV